MSFKPTSSTASRPDLDWSQVRETINMLTLAVSQIESSMRDGEKSVSELTESFTFIAGELQALIEKSQTVNNENNESMNALHGSTVDVHQRVVNAIIAFQFYDRLSQRLDHVKRDLSWLSQLVSNPEQLYNPAAWKKLQSDIMSNYSMEEERIMFEHIMQGASVEQALEVYQHHFSEKDLQDNRNDGTGDEVELF